MYQISLLKLLFHKHVYKLTLDTVILLYIWGTIILSCTVQNKAKLGSITLIGRSVHQAHKVDYINLCTSLKN